VPISEILTGIKKPEAVGSLRFYPNPFKGKIKIEFAGNNSSDLLTDANTKKMNLKQG